MISLPKSPPGNHGSGTGWFVYVIENDNSGSLAGAYPTYVELTCGLPSLNTSAVPVLPADLTTVSWKLEYPVPSSLLNAISKPFWTCFISLSLLFTLFITSSLNDFLIGPSESSLVEFLISFAKCGFKRYPSLAIVETYCDNCIGV